MGKSILTRLFLYLKISTHYIKMYLILLSLQYTSVKHILHFSKHFCHPNGTLDKTQVFTEMASLEK